MRYYLKWARNFVLMLAAPVGGGLLIMYGMMNHREEAFDIVAVLLALLFFIVGFAICVIAIIIAKPDFWR